MSEGRRERESAERGKESEDSRELLTLLGPRGKTQLCPHLRDVSRAAPLPSSLARKVFMQRLRRLDDEVVTQIAAGEVVHRPANAVKELLENCLDAGATKITVVLADGGLKFLQLTDNGCGIAATDLPAVCERHTTSKIAVAEDLKEIQTFGFRGEALASVSHISRVSITSFPSHQKCAFRLSYVNGRPVPHGQWNYSGPPPKAKPCAGNKGTVITAEDLFYNIATRRKALTNPNEEHNRCADVVRRYAIANPGVAFSVKKKGEATVSVQSRGEGDVLAAIRMIFGDSVAKHLFPFTNNHGNPSERGSFRAEGHFSALDAVGTAGGERKGNEFVLFVNGRWVSNQVGPLFPKM
jgi:DNA mismatch repair protein MLH1